MPGSWQAKRKGVCLLVDVVCHEGEARDAYLRRATHDVDQNWACLEPERKATVKAHITTVRPPLLLPRPPTGAAHADWLMACKTQCSVAAAPMRRCDVAHVASHEPGGKLASSAGFL